MKLTTLICSALATASLATGAWAAYPDKAIRIVVAYPAGGSVDVIARKIAQKLSEQMGQPVYVDNKPGATGTIGTQTVTRAPADGYTLLAIDNTYAVLPYVFKKLPWDYDKALVPITVSMFAPVVAVVRNDSPFQDLQALVSYARAHPGKVTFGSGGNGSTLHFSGEAFQLASNTKFTHIPYKGGGEAMTGLISSQVDTIFVSTPSVGAQVRSGRVRAIAVSGTKRLAAFPTLPTFAEAGVTGFSNINWSGLAAPAGTPPEVINRLHQEVIEALATSDLQAFLASMSAEPGGIDPAAFARLIKDETARWATVANTAAIERQ